MSDSTRAEAPNSAHRTTPSGGDLVAAVERCLSDVLGQSAPADALGFLARGGDSLRAVQLSQRLAETLGRTVSPGWLLATPEADAAAISEALGPVPEAHVLRSSAPGDPSAPSFSQERMWFMHQLAPAGLAYNVSQALRLNGMVDPVALEQAVRNVAGRHPILRSRFSVAATGLTMALPADGEVVLEHYVVSAAGGEAAAVELHEHAARLVRMPFDLLRGPVFRIALLQVGPLDSLLLLFAHHIVADQWSFDVLLRELAEAYNATVAGRVPQLSEDTPDFTAYVAWHRNWLQQERMSTELDYWVRRLRGLQAIALPSDRPRPAQQSFRGRRLRRALDPTLRDRLHGIAADEGATLATLLLTGLKLLLYAHTDRADIAVGVPVANRQHQGAAALVGTLVNTVVVRTDLSACADTLGVLAAVRASLLEALEHQDLPFEMLVKSLGMPRDAATTPLFTVMFNMLNTPLGDVAFEGLEWARFELDREAAQFDLTVTVDAEYDCSVVFEYATDLFEADSIQRFAERYFHLLASLAAAPRQALGADLCLPPGERALLDAWGSGPSRAVQPDTLMALIEAALRRPRGASLRWQGITLDTAALEQRSWAVTQSLQALGIGQGQRVAVCLPRTPGMLVALLGVIRTGATYVPLDPGYPVERLRFMVEDAGIAAVVKHRETGKLRIWRDLPRIVLTDSGELLEQPAPREDHPVAIRGAVTASDPAYLIYTSGSTGRPKGVMVSQGAVANFLLAMSERPGLADHDRLLAVTTPSFDIAVLELLLPLWSGASLVLASQEDLADGERLARLIREQRITALQATPSMWRMLLEQGWRGQPGLKALVGGEALRPRLAYQLAERVAEVWNMYGPTETTVWSSCWKLPARHEGAISLGTPIANTTFRVVDSRLQPCPIGAPGELLIGGAGLSLGYLGNPELTAERFVQTPHDVERMYRTGDRVRWCGDGTLEHLGRLDQQAKLRGYRIELGEIENCLSRHPAVEGNVVAIAEEIPGEARLIAYILPFQQMPPVAELRDFLRTWLPDYMVPQHFVELDAVPLLPNGKVDRNNLPAASAERIASLQHEYEARPATPLEQALLALWCEVLGIQDCGVTDSFFELGGHSMLALRLATRIEDRLGYHCPVATLFRHPDIRALGAALEDTADSVTDTLVALQPLGDRDPVFCLCGVSLYAKLAALMPRDRPVYGVFAQSELSLLTGNPEARPSVEQLAERYLELIRARQPTGPVHLVGFSLGSAIALRIAHLLRAAGMPVGTLLLLDGDAPGGARQSLRFQGRRLFKALARRMRRGLARAPTSTDDLPGRPHQTSSRRTPAAAPDRPFRDRIEAYTPDHYPGRAVFVEAEHSGRDSSFGWTALVGELQLLRLPSDHLGLLLGEARFEVARMLCTELSRFEQGDP